MNHIPATASTPADPDADTSVTVYENGPLIVRGAFALRAMDGSMIDPGRNAVALCRCGFSAIKPFCDGSHRRAGFSATGADERPRASGSRPDAHLRAAPPVEQRPSGGGVEGQAAGGAPEHG